MSAPSISAVRMTGAAHREELPLLVLGPSLGTSAILGIGAVAVGTIATAATLLFARRGKPAKRTAAKAKPKSKAKPAARRTRKAA